ncbi:tRNA (adenosine(37)-N6)-dimethylallyltransferase MiaA [Coxiella endosymbiont of Amblyomma sculptum]|uniref:tRNA (adenosine(37)-N6)-dimethylallyltransferase MiaA n=1 Tax=Coxiella endosymbiont of Amblyomma sculptum TaxID=2487929 RepID=UPI00132E91BD|nr:tRNA (adenosine(37)-N6)-dimethylallyltransferase MiaA [Coxiella endosymbiont of Amblyomma sculptum]QHG92592.1 tRNA (adenosine(37)-N6)-dimethylallyltransferase MiaA [Coxiella endosymbiont of Amblyomma sculptum]
MQKYVVCLMGPTASGKTRLSILLAQSYPFEIVSVDSAMVYRGFDIGTSKPAIWELQTIPHHLIDICTPEMPYSVGQFYKDALKKIALIHTKDRIPLLVGGTMLYFYALQHRFSGLPIAHYEIRKKILREAKEIGWTALHKKLKVVDPRSAVKINQNDTQRIQRALEVFEATGQPLSNCQNLNRLNSSYEFINIIISPANREDLYRNIEKRFDQMLQNGFLDEVKKLYQKNSNFVNLNLPAFRTVGYRQVWPYLIGRCNYATMRYRAIFATRHLAKKQITWLKRWSRAKRFDSNIEQTEQLAAHTIHYLRSYNLTNFIR